MDFDFNQSIKRTGTASSKWDGAAELFGSADILPMWVADMDFPAPSFVIEAMKERLEHGVMGYTFPSESYKASVQGWMEHRHHWKVEADAIRFSPGIVPALGMIVDAYTEAGDQVMIQPPVYPPFHGVVKERGRELVLNPLQQDEAGHYTMDFADMENKLRDGKVKMLILCSPHNPVGRVWTREELTKVEALCSQYNVLVVSDEIHEDLILDPHAVHIPFASLPGTAAEKSIICTAPSKTFNLAGLNTANVIIPDAEIREKFVARIAELHLSSITPMGAAATEAAYNQGEAWLESLLDYIRGNAAYVQQYIQEHLPELKLQIPEATYLLWMDFRALKMSNEDLTAFLVQQARLGLNNGPTFGAEGEGFMRMNLACTRATVEEAMKRLDQAITGWRASQTV
ncbi:PatB family C-S lyase [Paenibacillus sp. JX-17]|uniref:cysteine-S-conjugate beta-lyase n=1 Tax=Paenibacillus lacisoli TaxID=3064525 RepID=A0ABT9CGB9_9BACL|nr:PatB family C-S lyase [Paenibacillus sp. JX-17]MDO7907613.1 PatB family C-S lyase [Paenibacillus sp. JX-17]